MQPNLAHVGLEHVVPETVLRSTSLVVVQLCHHILRSKSNNQTQQSILRQHTTENDATVCTHAHIMHGAYLLSPVRLVTTAENVAIA